MQPKIELLQQIKRSLRDKYAWPGGYPLYLLCADGEVLSIDAARDNWKLICHATMFPQYGTKDWQIVAVDINWENPSLYCAHTNERIESAYAED